jgi:hypothetical protein
MIHGDRWLKGAHRSELEPISEAMRRIEAENGLGEDEFWALDEAPEEYKTLNREYVRILDRHFIPTLREFGESELADLARLTGRASASYERLAAEPHLRKPTRKWLSRTSSNTPRIRHTVPHAVKPLERLVSC